jgi:hypothetical protein
LILLAGFRHFQRPSPNARIISNSEPVGGGDEAEHLHAHFPRPWRKRHRVAAVFIGVRDDFSGALAGGNRCTGNRLVGGAHDSGFSTGTE